MAASWTTAPSRSSPAPTELLELRDSENALAAFPSERAPSVADTRRSGDGLRRAVQWRRQTGVTMRVTRLSPRLVLGLATILLVGAVTAAVIGLLAAREVPKPRAPQIAQQRPG